MAKRLQPKCDWNSLQQALSTFARATHGHQGQRHIKPLHWYIACRLVIEGGFLPDDITPRPPFQVRQVRGQQVLEYDQAAGGTGEQTVLGGLKTKDVDVVVEKSGVGPCIALSVKGTLKAFRNLTNRLEEAAGDCTNLHMVYPALVYGFWSLIRGNRAGEIPADSRHILSPAQSGENQVQIADVAIRSDATIANQIVQYGRALEGLTGRNGVRDADSKYEAVALTIVDPDSNRIGQLVGSHPEPNSPLRIDRFFAALYREYDLRFVYQAPALAVVTRRRFWEPHSPFLRQHESEFDFRPRAGDDAVAEESASADNLESENGPSE
jgi:hypothetical protein